MSLQHENINSNAHNSVNKSNSEDFNDEGIIYDDTLYHSDINDKQEQVEPI